MQYWEDSDGESGVGDTSYQQPSLSKTRGLAMMCGRDAVTKALIFVERRDEDKEREEEKGRQWRK